MNYSQAFAEDVIARATREIKERLTLRLTNRARRGLPISRGIAHDIFQDEMRRWFAAARLTLPS